MTMLPKLVITGLIAALLCSCSNRVVTAPNYTPKGPTVIVPTKTYRTSNTPPAVYGNSGVVHSVPGPVYRTESHYPSVYGSPNDPRYGSVYSDSRYRQPGYRKPSYRQPNYGQFPRDKKRIIKPPSKPTQPVYNPPVRRILSNDRAWAL